MRSAAWFVPVVLLLSGLAIASVAPIPIKVVQVGNETMTITLADITGRYIWSPVKKGLDVVSSQLSGIPYEDQIGVINIQLDKFEEYINQTLQNEEISRYWPYIYSAVLNKNKELTGRESSIVILCVYKGVVESCRTYKLLEEPGIEVLHNYSIGNYLTIKIPYSIFVAINEHLENRDYESLKELVKKAVVRNEIEFNVKPKEQLQVPRKS